jgi:hypothetical protein
LPNRSNLPEGENRTNEIFLKNGGFISANNVEVSRSLILTDITFSLDKVDLYCIGFNDGSSYT